MANISIKLTNPEGGTLYVPVGTQLEAVDANNGQPIADSYVFVGENNALDVGPASDKPITPRPEVKEAAPEPAPQPENKLSADQQAQLASLDGNPDTKDIPEAPAENWKTAQRGKFAKK